MRSDLIQYLYNKLVKNPSQFTFTQANRIIDLHSNQGVKLISYLSLSVPKNDCISLNTNKNQLTLNAMSLLGINGVLPKYYSEQAYLNYKNHLFAFAEFIHIFENRYFSLKFKIEKTYEQTLQNTPDFKPCYQVTGTANIEIQDILSPFLSLFLNKNKNIKDLEFIIYNLTTIDVKIYQFQEKWYKIPRHYRLVLNSSPLINKALGEKTKNVQSAILIKLSFDNYSKYLEYFNNKEQKELLEKVIKYYLNNEIQFKIETTIKALVTNTIKLDQNNQLGYTTWL